MAPAARDRLGRPVDSRDVTAATPPLDPDLPRSPSEAVTVGQQLLDAGFPFAAHEVFEVQWKSRPDDERDLWQGLAQVCVALTHAERGNAHGAAQLKARAAEHLARADAERAGQRYTVDVAGLVQWCGEAATWTVPRVPVKDA